MPNLLGAFWVVAAEEFRGLAEVAGPSAPARHDQGEAGTNQPAADAAGQDFMVGVGGGLGGPSTPAREK
jgi:hypothetical protein